jgi:hypothetical protein
MKTKKALVGIIGFAAVLFFAALVLAQPQGGAPAQGGDAAQSTGKTTKGMTGLTPGQQPDLIAQMDADKDGKVTQAEWVAWGRPEKLFAKYDKNSNGSIDTDEKPTGMPSFELTDINGDGKVVADEFPGPEAMVKQFDKDGNGYLTESELSSPPGGGQGGGASAGGQGGAPGGQAPSGSAPAGAPAQK